MAVLDAVDDLNGVTGVHLIGLQLHHTSELAARWVSDDGLEYLRGASEILAAMIGAYEDNGLRELVIEWATIPDADQLTFLDREPSDSPCPALLDLLEKLG